MKRMVLCWLVLMTSPAAAEGDHDWVRQTVHGMDCAPCAYAVERGLERMPGVLSVTVSLEQGHVEVLFGEDADIDIASLREVVRSNGFTPRAAEVRLTGSLDEGGLLNIGHLRYRVYADGVPADALTARRGRQVMVFGVVSEDDPRGIAATRVDSR